MRRRGRRAHSASTMVVWQPRAEHRWASAAAVRPRTPIRSSSDRGPEERMQDAPDLLTGHRAVSWQVNSIAPGSQLRPNCLGDRRSGRHGRSVRLSVRDRHAPSDLSAHLRQSSARGGGARYLGPLVDAWRISGRAIRRSPGEPHCCRCAGERSRHASSAALQPLDGGRPCSRLHLPRTASPLGFDRRRVFVRDGRAFRCRLRLLTKKRHPPPQLSY